MTAWWGLVSKWGCLRSETCAWLVVAVCCAQLGVSDTGGCIYATMPIISLAADTWCLPLSLKKVISASLLHHTHTHTHTGLRFNLLALLNDMVGWG